MLQETKAANHEEPQEEVRDTNLYFSNMESKIKVFQINMMS